MELRHKINLKVEIRGPYAVNVQGINPVVTFLNITYLNEYIIIKNVLII